MDDKIASLLCLDFSPGDLVRLTEDDQLKNGLGLVMEVRRDLSDIKDLQALFQILHGQIIEEVFPSKPHLLIMWSSPLDRDIWMYATDVVIYKKA